MSSAEKRVPLASRMWDSFESNSSSGEEDDRSVQKEPCAKNGDGFHRGESGRKPVDRPEELRQPQGRAGSANFCERNQVTLERVAMSEKAHSFSHTLSQEDKKIPHHQCSLKRSNVRNESSSDSSMGGKFTLSDNAKNSTQDEALGIPKEKFTNSPPSFLRSDRQPNMSSRENSSSPGFEEKTALSADPRQLKEVSSFDVKAQGQMHLPTRDTPDNSVAPRTSLAEHGTTVGSGSLDASASEVPCDSSRPIDRSSMSVTTGETDVREKQSPRHSPPKEPKPRIAQGLLTTIFRRKSGQQPKDKCDGRDDKAEYQRSKLQWPIRRRRSLSSTYRRALHEGDASSQLELSNSTQVLENANRGVDRSIKSLRGDAKAAGSETLFGGCAAERSIGDMDAGDTTETRTSFTSNMRKGHSRGQEEQMSGTHQELNRDPRTSRSRVPGVDSSSLGTKLGLSLRRAIVGNSSLGVRFPRKDDSFIVHASEPRSDDSDDSFSIYGEKTCATRAKHARKRIGQQSGVRRRPRDECSDTDRDDEGANLPGNRCDSDVSSPGNSREAFTPCINIPRNLPEAVQSYIHDRARTERELSAPEQVVINRLRSFKLRLIPATQRRDCRRGGSLDISKEASSTTQLSGEHLPFTEAMFKAGVSETLHSTKQGILMEGELYKFSPESVRGVRWHKRYFVLFAVACELRYYKSYANAAWGRIPLGERGSIPLRLVVKIEQPSNKKYRGCRFDLVVLHKGQGRHPGLHISPGRESQSLTTKTFKLSAANAQRRLMWVTVIEALMRSHGWGIEAARYRNMRARPRYGVIRGSASTDSKAIVSIDGESLSIRSGVDDKNAGPSFDRELATVIRGNLRDKSPG